MKTTKHKKAGAVEPIVKPSIGWAITGVHMGARYFYTGWWLTRIEAIRSHCNDKFIIPSPKAPTLASAWRLCRKKGDRSIKVIIEQV